MTRAPLNRKSTALLGFEDGEAFAELVELFFERATVFLRKTFARSLERFKLSFETANLIFEPSDLGCICLHGGLALFGLNFVNALVCSDAIDESLSDLDEGGEHPGHNCGGSKGDEHSGLSSAFVIV